MALRSSGCPGPSTVLLQPDDPRFSLLPACLPGLGSPASLQYIGDLDLLSEPKVALLCSQRCPGSIILKTYDLMQSMKLYECVVVGGFQAPMEQECLRILMSGRTRMIVCPAHTIGRMRVPAAWRPRLESGRLLVVSPFGSGERRSTVRIALERNRFVAGLAEFLVVPFAAPRSKTEGIVRAVLARNRPVCTFDDAANRAILDLGAVPVESLFTWLPPIQRAPDTLSLAT